MGKIVRLGGWVGLIKDRPDWSCTLRFCGLTNDESVPADDQTPAWSSVAGLAVENGSVAPGAKPRRNPCAHDEGGSGRERAEPDVRPVVRRPYRAWRADRVPMAAVRLQCARRGDEIERHPRRSEDVDADNRAPSRRGCEQLDANVR